MDKQVAASEVRELVKRGTDAMQQFIDGRHMLHIPPQPDDADMVIAECLRTMDAFADLLESLEKAEPVAYVLKHEKLSFKPTIYYGEAETLRRKFGGETVKLYTHPVPADESAQTNDDAEQLRLCREDWQKVCDVIHPGWHFNPEEIVEKLKAAADAERLAEALRAFPEDPNPFTYRRCYANARAALATHSAKAQPPAASVTDEMVMRLKHALPLFCADVTMADARTALEAALAAQENPNG